jgi:acyl-CoA dehydrogenase
MTVSAERDAEFLADVARIADDVAAPNADDVDRNARFPSETIDALREAGGLAALIPEELGGLGLDFRTVAEACVRLGRRCGSSAMVFAMHQIKVATIVRHLEGSPWFEDFLRDVASDQLLIASVTSEIGTGGDLGRSIAALTPAEDGGLAFEKQAPTVSYGAHADAYLTTLRRAPEAEQGDQVIVVSLRDQTELEPAGAWDTLGMRGTCSPGFVVRARIRPEQVLAAPFSDVLAVTMVPVTHLLWSHLWLGIATDAFDRARAFVRAAAKRGGKVDGPLPQAVRLSHLMSELSLLRAEVRSALDEFMADDARERLSTMAGQLRFNNLKIAASEQAPRVCQGALSVCGIAGFRNDSPYSVGRHLRDTLSAALMIANERIHNTNANLLLIAKEV